jgi:alpha-aminoadipic semialdehyde synthase
MMRLAFTRRLLLQQQHQQQRAATTIAILRETYDKWERRAPLTPSQVAELAALDDDIHVLVQPCSHRIFRNEEYVQAGASLDEGLTRADILLGVKQPKTLISDKTYLFFSHTVKGQAENMGLLRQCLDQRVQLLDYERVRDENSKRVVSFGRFAGLAGAIDTLGALGRRLLYKGISTPLLHIPPAYMHASLPAARECVKQAAQVIEKEGLTEPLVVAITGQGGTVHSGVMELLQLLPHTLVNVQDLPRMQLEPKLYLCPVSISDVFERSDGQRFDRTDFAERPSLYRSLFAKRVAPFSQCIVNCVYWDPRFPRLLSKESLKRLYEKQGQSLMLVSDLSCDVHGSMEFLEHTTTLERPFFQYDPLSGSIIADEITDSGLTVMGVDILPAELPRESSEHFGSAVKDIVVELARAQKGTGDDSDSLISPELVSSLG